MNPDTLESELPFTETAVGGDVAEEPVVGQPVPNSSQATTLISELTTALGTIRKTLAEAIAYMPTELLDVPARVWQTLTDLHEDPQHNDLFEMSFANGRSFAESALALRHRQPQRVEWCGPRKVGGEDAIPADLRIDDVYLISCKYNSQHLSNSGPSKLFENRLRETPTSPSWYGVVAPVEYQSYYESVREHFGLASLPVDVTALTVADREVLKSQLPRALPAELSEVQADFCQAVSIESANRWTTSLGTPKQQADFAMSMLRIPQAVYFLLGQKGSTALRFKVLSRWDWEARFEIKGFSVAASTAMQPTVTWQLDVLDRALGTEQSATGHVEIRWSHRRFNGAPEAKVVLDSELRDTPGYLPLDD
jgi:hypothetical protein